MFEHSNVRMYPLLPVQTSAIAPRPDVFEMPKYRNQTSAANVRRQGCRAADEYLRLYTHHFLLISVPIRDFMVQFESWKGSGVELPHFLVKKKVVDQQLIDFLETRKMVDPEGNGECRYSGDPNI